MTMIREIFTGGDQYRYILIFVVLVFSGFQPKAKLSPDIILQDERLSVTPKEFYIANVIDNRDDRAAVALLLPAITQNNPPISYRVDLHDGAIVAIKQFVNHNLPTNKSLRPVIIKLKKFMATESVTQAGRVEGHVSLIMSFNLDQGEDEMLHLVDYNGGATYTRNLGPAQEIEPTLRHLLENGLVYINTWMDKQAGTNVKLAKAVNVVFSDFEEKPEGDTIYYSFNRPLTWNDFQSKIGNNRYEAEVFPTIGYDERTEINKGVIIVHLAVKVGLPKSASWVKDGYQNALALNHEQRHFDIVKLVAEHFKQKIKAQTLPVGNFDGPINMEYLDTYREMDSLQNLYDGETRHGTDQSAQQRWNEKIDKELGGKR
jgi:hypothetical protein